MTTKKPKGHSQVHGPDAKAAPEPARRRSAAPPRAAASLVAIDYPVEGERVRAGHYTVRVRAPEGSEVQVSLDGRTWGSCRAAAGYYWYDWSPADAGPCSLRARARSSPGRWRLSEPRACTVVAGPA
jgi:hypothetical protein